MAGAAALLALGALAAGEGAPPPALRPSALLEDPARFLNRTVEVEIVERLNGVGGEPLAQACVGVPESAGCTLSLVPPGFEPGAVDRRTRRFEAPLVSPVRVRGQFLRDDGLGLSTPGYVIRVVSSEPLPAETPVVVASVKDLLSQKERLDRRLVVLEGRWQHGFERSTLDGLELWLSVSQDTVVTGQPPKKREALRGNRVRVTGRVFARPGRRYGHMGQAAALLSATRLEHLKER